MPDIAGHAEDILVYIPEVRLALNIDCTISSFIQSSRVFKVT